MILMWFRFFMINLRANSLQPSISLIHDNLDGRWRAGPNFRLEQVQMNKSFWRVYGQVVAASCRCKWLKLQVTIYKLQVPFAATLAASC